MPALALRNKKEVEGRRDRERERRYFQKKRGGGVKASLNDFFALEGRERQTTVWTFQGGDTLVTSSTHFTSFTRLSDKSPPLHNARHEGTRNVSLSFIVIAVFFLPKVFCVPGRKFVDLDAS